MARTRKIPDFPAPRRKRTTRKRGRLSPIAQAHVPIREQLAAGKVGAILVAVWAAGLLRDAGKVLLDAEMDAPVVQEIHEVIADSPWPAAISDLHVWRVGRGRYACIVALVSASDATPTDFKRLLGVHEELVHISVEINRVSA